MRNLKFIILSCFLSLSLCANILNDDTGCTIDTDLDVSPSLDTCVDRIAATAGYSCCLFKYKIGDGEYNSCYAAKKKKAKTIVKEAKSGVTQDGIPLSDVSLLCESSMIQLYTYLALLSLLLF